MKSLDDENAPEVPDGLPSAEDLLSRAEEGERLRQAVLTLSEDLRFTVTAHFWGGLAVKEIAAIEEITTVAIRKRLHKAFTLLEEVLGGSVGKEER
jgi:DNA-directed RNA polymerase specialized sigma24 family protein